jgi:hypothetical protein
MDDPYEVVKVVSVALVKWLRSNIREHFPIARMKGPPTEAAF